MDSEIIEATQLPSVPLTQECGKSHIKYAYTVLFKVDVNETKPFIIVPVKTFAKSNFPWRAPRLVFLKDFCVSVNFFADFITLAHFIQRSSRQK